MRSTIHRTPCASSSSIEALEARCLMAAVVDDAYEPNDSPRQVLALESPGGPLLGGVEGELAISGLRLMDRADWFRFRLTAQGEAGDEAEISFRNRRGNLDLALFNSRGRVQLESSATNANSESISLNGLEEGWYMLRITGRNNAGSPNYQLSLDCPTAIPDDDGGDDGGETPIVEYNDSFDLVDSAPVGTQGSPSLGALVGPVNISGVLDDSYDIYKFTVSATPGDAAHVSIASTHAFNLSLFNSGRQSIGFAAGYMGQTSISLANLAPGDYYIQVTHYVLGLEGSFNYELGIDGFSSQNS